MNTFRKWDADVEWEQPTGFVSLRSQNTIRTERESWARFIESSSRPDATDSIAAFLAGKTPVAMTAFADRDGIALTTITKREKP